MVRESGSRYFPRFLAAFEAMCAALKPRQRKLPYCSVCYLSSAQSIALKAVLHEEVKALVEAARTQALVTPKQFGDATMLPANHIEWTRSCRRPRLRLRSSMSACAC